MSRGYFQIYSALKLSNVATFPSTFSKHSVNSIQIISTIFIKIQRARAAGKPIRRRHAHMHTRKDPASMLIWQRNSRPILLGFHPVPPLAAEAAHADDWAPEAISSDEIDKVFEYSTV